MIIAALVLLVPTAFAFEALFETRVDLPVGNGPSSVAFGDFNFDGDLDIAISCQEADSLYIAFSDGAGWFHVAIAYPVMVEPSGVVAGDFNLDAALDLAVVGLSDSVWILINDGSGVFSHTSDYAVGLDPSDMIAAHLNDDSFLDLVVESRGLSILFGNGNGTFQSPVEYLWLAMSEAVAAFDFDGDTDIDLVTTSHWEDGAIHRLRNNGFGVFDTLPNISMKYPRVAVPVDLNDDYIVDLALFAGDSVHAMLNSGSGAFTIDSTYYTGHYAAHACAADLNLDTDTHKDIIVASMYDLATVVMNNGDCTLAPPVTYVTSDNCEFVAAPDLDKDNDSDLVLVNFQSDNLTVLRNPGNGIFPVEPRFAAGNRPESICKADFDNDGYVDLATVDDHTNNFTVLLNNHDRTFGPAVTYSLIHNGYSICAADFDQNGYEDIVVADTGLAVMLNDGDGTFSGAEYYACKEGDDPRSMIATDLNGDGFPDLAVADEDWDGSLHIFINGADGSGSLATAVSYPLAEYPMSVCPFDLDNDNDTDLVIPCLGDDFAILMLNDGAGVFSIGAILHVGELPIAAAAGDFDEDGLTDLAFNIDLEEDMAVFKNNGDTTFQYIGTYGTGEYCYDILARDFDEDGHLDLAVPSSEAHCIHMFIGDGAGGFEHSVDYGTSLTPMAAVAADFDNDGFLDLAACNEDDNNISVLYNRMLLTWVDEASSDGDLPVDHLLAQNYPNPFNPITSIEYSLPRRSHVTIEVYNILGQGVRTLVDREEPAGSYTITWDGKTATGKPAATGLYLYRFQVGDHVETKKMLLVK
ncbi:MAG: hypothetical protein DRP45_01090 [Candidatus Zixiibacteriota bacterium]|nr:MAG: hypothetical protein DRP45_01090 [candidate division Zixibacteria bacterium]